MPTILEKIIQTKREEIAQRRAQTPLEQLKANALAEPRPRNFFKAVTKRPTRALNLIAEIKKDSPSGGVIKEDFDPVAIARTYASAGADALSVLTDEQYFQGRLDFL